MTFNKKYFFKDALRETMSQDYKNKVTRPYVTYILQDD